MDTIHGAVRKLCTTCGSEEVLSVPISMEDGRVRFWTCTMCEATGWERDGSPIARTIALAHIPRR